MGSAADDRDAIPRRLAHAGERLAEGISKSLDFFGRNRANFAAATSLAEAAEAEAAAAAAGNLDGRALYYAELVRLTCRSGGGGRRHPRVAKPAQTWSTSA